MTIERVATLVTLVWPLFSGLFNILFRWKTDEQWVEFCERRPWGAMVVKFIRTAGLDPVGVVRAVRQFVETKQRRRSTVPPAPRPTQHTWVAEMERNLSDKPTEPPPPPPEPPKGGD